MRKIVGGGVGSSRPYDIDLEGHIHYHDQLNLNSGAGGAGSGATTPIIEVPNPDVSLDDIGKRIITALDRAVKHLSVSVTGGDVSREVIGALKDCQTMVRDMKKDEKDFLTSLTDEELTKLAKS